MVFEIKVVIMSNEIVIRNNEFIVFNITVYIQSDCRKY